MSNNYDASASLLGYLYQCRSALLFALREGRTRPDLAVFIERFDDVSFASDDDPMRRVQIKHTLSSGKSLSDRSTDLWKTIRIWSEAVYTGEIDPKEAVLSLVTVAEASTDSIAGRLGGNGRDETYALDELTRIAKAGGNQDNAPGHEAFLELTHTQRTQLVSAITIFPFAANVIDIQLQLHKEVAYVVDRKFVTPFLERLEGWWINRVINQLSADTNEPIRILELETRILDIQSQFEAENLTIDHALAEPPAGVDASGDKRIFVEQLRLIAVSNPRIAAAILDYYRAVQQRSTWLAEDQLVLDELSAYENRLVDEWQRRYHQMIEDLQGDPDESERQREGRHLFNWFQNQADIPIRPKCREPYVLRGTYHLLANGTETEKPRVGWHPQFIERLQTLLSEAFAQ